MGLEPPQGDRSGWPVLGSKPESDRTANHIDNRGTSAAHSVPDNTVPDNTAPDNAVPRNSVQDNNFLVFVPGREHRAAAKSIRATVRRTPLGCGRSFAKLQFGRAAHDGEFELHATEIDR